MSPTIVLSNGNPYIAVGGRGGPTIIGTVINVLIRTLIHNMNAQQAINAPRVYGMNGIFSPVLITFEKDLWEQYNANITNEMVTKFEYNENYLFNLVFGSGNMIIIGDDNLLYCGVDTSRLETEGCSAVCNSNDSFCIFSMTTMYPETTMDIPKTTSMDLPNPTMNPSPSDGQGIYPTVLNANSSINSKLSDGVIIIGIIICIILC